MTHVHAALGSILSTTEENKMTVVLKKSDLSFCLGEVLGVKELYTVDI